MMLTAREKQLVADALNVLVKNSGNDEELELIRGMTHNAYVLGATHAFGDGEYACIQPRI